MTDLTSQSCAACEGWVPPLSDAQKAERMAALHGDWTILEDGKTLMRRFTFKGFAKATYTANLAAFLGDREGHHPDVRFGWGYCEVRFTSHELDRLTENDFICAAKLDQVVAG